MYKGFGPVYGKDWQDKIKNQFPYWEEILDLLEEEVNLEDERKLFNEIKYDSERWVFKNNRN